MTSKCVLSPLLRLWPSLIYKDSSVFIESWKIVLLLVHYYDIPFTAKWWTEPNKNYIYILHRDSWNGFTIASNKMYYVNTKAKPEVSIDSFSSEAIIRDAYFNWISINWRPLILIRTLDGTAKYEKRKIVFNANFFSQNNVLSFQRKFLISIVFFLSQLFPLSFYSIEINMLWIYFKWQHSLTFTHLLLKMNLICFRMISA